MKTSNTYYSRNASVPEGNLFILNVDSSTEESFNIVIHIFESIHILLMHLAFHLIFLLTCHYTAYTLFICQLRQQYLPHVQFNVTFSCAKNNVFPVRDIYYVETSIKSTNNYLYTNWTDITSYHFIGIYRCLLNLKETIWNELVSDIL